MSLLAYHDTKATVKGLKDFPKDERPPVTLPFIAFRIMVGLGFLFLAVTLYGWFKRNDLEANPKFLKAMILILPLPYIANEAGWMLAEVGRQPWVVYGVMKTSAAVSPISVPQVMTSLVAFILVYSLLGAAAFYLMVGHARQGLNLTR